jgi:hypothetical protein
MLVSVFTPTHNPRFLARAEASLRQQTYQEFEWVLVPNGPARPDHLAVTLPQARIAPYTGDTQHIGEIKSFSCAQARGEILVELDHDDELLPNCLERLVSAFRDKTVDFVYSNCIEVGADSQPRTYNSAYGWKYRPFPWKGQSMLEALSFPPTPISFSKIWYAPNHVRAWRTRFYHKIGGHDVGRSVLDDQDLLCRTYIHGKVQHLSECLYVYHYHDQNTCTNTSDGTNQYIQSTTLDLHDQYIYKLVARWCDLNQYAKIDLCGGHSKEPGYTSVDLENGDVTADLNERWPFADNSVGVFRAHDALEHMKDPIHVMKEIYRCLVPGGWLLSLTPSTDGRGAFQDPTHVSFWNSNSFWYYTRAQQARYINTPVRFQLNHLKNFFPTPWHEQHNIVYVKADLVKITEGIPGLIEI